jgi:hypothetical protein
MSNYHITTQRVNAEGFKKLRDKIENEERNHRTVDRNKMITSDAQKLIGQILAGRKVADFANWLTWKDDDFFETIAKIYPSGKTSSIRHLHDYLSKIPFNWFLDDHTLSLQAFMAEVNEATRIFQGELDIAEQRKFLPSVQREAVGTLLNRITAGHGDSVRQPSLVRVCLKGRILHSGKPLDIDEFLDRLVAEAEVIAEAHTEMAACGYTYKPSHPGGRNNDLKTGAAAVSESQRLQLEKAQKRTDFICNGCGGKGHKYRVPQIDPRRLQ